MHDSPAPTATLDGAGPFRHTKIIATLGPATTPEVIGEMADAGLDVARLNFSHGTHEDHAALIAAVRRASARTGRPIAVLGDLCGPKIRVRDVHDDGIDTAEGDELHVAPATVDGAVTVTASDLLDHVEVGHRILFADGSISAVVSAVHDDRAAITIEQGGTLLPNKGVNLPDTPLGGGLTSKDRSDIEFAVEHGVDVIAVSFVRTDDDVLEVRRLAGELPVVAKIERPEAVANFDSIADAADAVMVARGDLGVELPLATIPRVQKDLVARANDKGCTVIVATEMLESMTTAARPTRAEVSDAANAVLDGADAVMLSAETAVGHHPAAVVALLAQIIVSAETGPEFAERCETQVLQAKHSERRAALAAAAVRLARDLDAAAIAVVSETGRTADFLSAGRPRTPVIAFTTDRAVWRRLALSWGVQPRLLPRTAGQTTGDLLKYVGEQTERIGHLKRGDQVVVLAGEPGTRAGSDRLQIFSVGGRIA